MKEFYQKYQGHLPALFFVGGFLFDIFTTDRIDQTFSLIQQVSYLFLIMLFFYWELFTPKVFLKEGGFLNKLWKYHVELLHFLFGSLLSLYTIFYFKSASLMTSFAFMIFLTAILVINEFPQFQRRGAMIRSTLLALCLSSYLVYLVPVVTAAIGWGAFLLAIILSSSVFILFARFIYLKGDDKKWIKKNIFIPGILVNLIFVLLYFFKLLPPVPISLKYIGIYHDIQKPGTEYVLNYEREWWRFWESGAQTYVYREGDKLYCFVSIFSPTQFSDQMKLMWLKKTKGAWKKRDSVSLSIKGGRAEGYRGYAYKENFEPGPWQVRVLTSDLREVGRIYFEVVEAEPGSSRVWQQDLY